MAKKPRAAALPRTLERNLPTPEGVTLRLRLGSGGARAGAFMIDGIIMILILVGVSMLIGLALWGEVIADGGKGASVYAIIWLLGAFVLRNFYFVLHETGRRAATPGKRLLKLRVVARDGGRLTGSAVMARNLMREIEVFLPIGFFGFASAEGMVSAWTGALALGWVLIFAFMPLFNRDRMRAGDLIGGTWVVEREVRALGQDMLVQTSHENQMRRVAPFTAAELDAYGAFELHRLEDILRRNDRTDLFSVAAAIRRKIGRADEGADLAFLEAYYAALRGHLERKLLFGTRKRDKFDVTA